MSYNTTCMCIFLAVSMTAGVSFSEDRLDPGYKPSDGEIKAFVFEILQREMPSQLDSFKGDLEIYFKNVCGCVIDSCVA